MSFGRSGGGTQVVTQSNAPWGPQGMGLQKVFGEADKLYSAGGPKYFPGSTVADFAPETEQALQMTAKRATQGSDLTRAAQAQSGATLRGDYLNSNPYLDATFNRASNAVTRAFKEATVPGLNATFTNAGRLDGGNAKQTAFDQATNRLGQTLSDLGTEIYGGNYQQERLNQQRAMALAPSLASQDYQDIGQLAAAGGQREELAQAKLGDQINRFNFEQQAPANSLAQYLAFISGNYGGTNTTTQPIYRNTLANTLGGGVAGGTIGSMFGSQFTPYGAGLGLLAGLL